MGMPKGMKHQHGYATVTGQGMGYREIAEIMSSEGKKMNHATARNYFIRAMRKLAKSVVSHTPDGDADRLASDPRFQSAIIEILKDKDNVF